MRAFFYVVCGVVTFMICVGVAVYIGFTALPGLFHGSWGSLVGSGRLATETRPVGSFSKISAEGSADVDVVAGPDATVTVTADDNLLSAIKTEVDGDTLHIGSRHPYVSGHAVKIHVVAPSLSAISSSGSGDIQGSGLSAGAFSMDLTGSGDVTLAGTATRLDVGVTGSGDVNAGGLVAGKADVSVTGSGDVVVDATDSLSASILGSGDVHYLGHPAQVEKRVLGSGEVSPQ